jgi:hypothetical protein
MHPHSNGFDSDWDWQPPRTSHQLTLLLSQRMAAQLQAVAHDLELATDECALLLLRETLWRHYHMMQHI